MAQCDWEARRHQVMASARRVVIKVGSAVLAGAHGGVDAAVVAHLAAQIAGLADDGRQGVLVSSGAVAAGTISRKATQSHSLERPSKGRATWVTDSRLRALPWQALYLLPEPQGQGSRRPTTGISSLTRRPYRRAGRRDS